MAWCRSDLGIPLLCTVRNSVCCTLHSGKEQSTCSANTLNVVLGPAAIHTEQLIMPSRQPLPEAQVTLSSLDNKSVATVVEPIAATCDSGLCDAQHRTPKQPVQGRGDGSAVACKQTLGEDVAHAFTGE